MLTYIQINAAKPRDKAWSLSDSQGLYLVIQPNGSRLWRFRYRFLDRQKTLHLGGWVQPCGAASSAGTGLPRNALTARNYSGVNVLILWGAVIEHEWPSQSWLSASKV